MSNLVPEGWKESKVGDSCFVTKLAGYEYTSHFDYSIGGEIIAVRVLNLKKGKLDLSQVQTIPRATSDALPRSKLAKNDLVISYVGTVGEVAFIDEDDRYHLAPNVAKITPDKNEIDGKFLAHVFTSDDTQKSIKLLGSVTSQPSLSMGNLRKVFVPLPPLSEQKKIAAILTSVDDVIEKTQAQIDKLKDLKTGMMQELLTRGVGVDGKPHTEFKDSPVGRIPKSWEVVNVGSLVDVIDPQPDHRTPPEVENGIPYVGLGDIDKSGVINFSGARKVSQAAFDKQCKSFELHKGAFVFGKIGTIGNPSILPEQRFYCLSANVVLITGVNYEVLRYIFQVFTSSIINEQIALQTNTTSQPALGIKKVRDFLVPLPTHSEMKSLVDALSSIDRRLAVVKTKLDKLKSSKKALMQDLLTGKVRVKVEG
ncbi:type I restriction modification DNA specificity domain protein [Vibrio harveyi]|uniref:restriction endonuclease subunit S n=1 Tax=Vibrio harveyi TaxID=669 RepID=UPI00028C0260|nr:restriction endonuclease subunit S [Vibrio harveyi]EKM15319.1 type I restriction modification DNA specificity domain protein [Vibrio harveyi]